MGEIGIWRILGLGIRGTYELGIWSSIHIDYKFSIRIFAMDKLGTLQIVTNSSRFGHTILEVHACNGRVM